jgi:hypothetical protein
MLLLLRQDATDEGAGVIEGDGEGDTVRETK